MRFDRIPPVRASGLTLLALLAFALATCATPPTPVPQTPATASNPMTPLPPASSLPTSKNPPPLTAAPTSPPTLLPTPITSSPAFRQLPEITVASDFRLLVSPLHAQSFLPGGEVRAGAKPRVLATEQNGAWLLVIHDELLGWIPAIVSGGGLGTLGVMIVDTPINPCTAYLGAFGRYNDVWESPVSGTVMVEGIIYRPQPARRDDPRLILQIEGGGQSSAPQFVHKPQGASSELLQYRLQIDNLRKGSRVRLEAPGMMGEPFAFVLGFFTKDCGQEANVPAPTAKSPNSAGNQIKPPTPITVIVETGPKADSTPMTPRFPAATPAVSGPQVTFEENFSGSSLDNSKWSVENNLGNSLSVSGGVLRLSSSSQRIPYVYNRSSVFPTSGEFRLTLRYRYAQVSACGATLSVTSSFLPPFIQGQAANVQEPDPVRKVSFFFWHELFWYDDQSGRKSVTLSSNYTASHEIHVDYVASRYRVTQDGTVVFVSDPNTARPRYIAFGNAAIQTNTCPWDSLEIDYVKVERLQ